MTAICPVCGQQHGNPRDCPGPVIICQGGRENDTIQEEQS